MKAKRKPKSEYFYGDLAAVLLGVGVFALFFATARLGVPTVDEADYCNLRYLQGDVPFVEWWDPAQLFWLTMAPVVWTYKTVTGATDGLLLFMRYFFLAADAVFYAFMYRRLRRYRAAGLAAALLFCAVLPQTLRAVSYFTVSAFIFYGVALMLMLDDQKRSPLRLALLGALLAVGVMTEPFLLAVYALYVCFAVLFRLLRKKKTPLSDYAFVLEPRVCLWLTLGAFAVFLALVAFLAAKGTFRRLPEMLPFIFGGTKYTGASVFSDAKFRLAVSFYGKAVSVGFLLLPAAGAVTYFIKRPLKGLRMGLFALSCVFAAFCWGRLFFGVAITHKTDLVNAINYHGVLMLPFAVSWYFLAKKREPRVFACLAAALLYGAAVDLGSSSVLGTGGNLAAFPGLQSFLLLVREAADEMKRAAKEKAVSRLLRTCAGAAALAASAACVLGLVFWSASFVGLETVDPPIEGYISPMFSGSPAECTAAVTRGPFAGIVTSEKIASVYNDALEDLDLIRAEADGAPFMTYGFTPFAYLYLDLPYGAHGAWYDGDLSRTVAFWEKFPERRPAFIYYPLFDNLYWATLGDMRVSVSREGLAREAQRQLSALGELTVSYGKAGLILRADEVLPVP